MDEHNSGDPPLLHPSGKASASAPATEGWADWQAVLRNRFILAGLGLLVVLLLVAIVLFAVGGEDENGTSGVAPQPTSDGVTTPVLGPGLPGQLRTTTTMRNGPGSTYAILGTIPRDSVVTVVGRNEDDTWLQVLYPPGTQLRGWVRASLIDVNGDVSELVIAGPGEQPDVPVPTFAGPVFTPVATEPGSEFEPTRTRRPTFTPVPTWTPRPTRTPPPTSTPGPVPTTANEPPDGVTPNNDA
jgi:uncharacterized protein YraI